MAVILMAQWAIAKPAVGARGDQKTDKFES